MSAPHPQLTGPLSGTHPAVLNRRIHDLLIVTLTGLIPLVLALAIAVEMPKPNFAAVIGIMIGAAAVVALMISTRYEVTLAVLVLYLGLLDGPIKLESASQLSSGIRDILIIAIVLGMVMRLALSRERVRLPPLSGWVLAFVAVTLVAALNPHTHGFLKILGGYRQQLVWVPFFFFGYLFMRS